MTGTSFPSEIDDPIVAGALKHFKASVDAWSEAAYSRPRFNESRLSESRFNESRPAARSAQHNWRLAASWALGCLLIAGSLAGGLFEHHQRQEAARAAEIKAAEQKVRLAARNVPRPCPRDQHHHQTAATGREARRQSGRESAGNGRQRCIAAGSSGHGAAGANDGRQRHELKITKQDSKKQTEKAGKGPLLRQGGRNQ